MKPQRKVFDRKLPLS